MLFPFSPPAKPDLRAHHTLRVLIAQYVSLVCRCGVDGYESKSLFVDFIMFVILCMAWIGVGYSDPDAVSLAAFN